MEMARSACSSQNKDNIFSINLHSKTRQIYTREMPMAETAKHQTEQPQTSEMETQLA